MNYIQQFLINLNENRHLMSKQEYNTLKGQVKKDYQGAIKGYRKILMKNKKIDVYRRD